MPSELQKQFFASMREPQCFRQLFDLVPDASFFVKDARGRFIAASSTVLQHLGLGSEDELVGRTDDDFYPAELTRSFRADDQEVIRTGRPILNRVEPCFKGLQLLDWFITSKLPLHGKGGKIIGIMGLTRSYEGQRGSYAPFRELAKAMDCIRRDLRGKICLEGLARAAGMSQRQLNRKFHAAFGMTPTSSSSARASRRRSPRSCKPTAVSPRSRWIADSATRAASPASFASGSARPRRSSGATRRCSSSLEVELLRPSQGSFPSGGKQKARCCQRAFREG